MAPVNLIEAHSLSFLRVISVKIQENKILVFGSFWSFGRVGACVIIIVIIIIISNIIIIIIIINIIIYYYDLLLFSLNCE